MLPTPYDYSGTFQGGYSARIIASRRVLKGARKVVSPTNKQPRENSGNTFVDLFTLLWWEHTATPPAAALHSLQPRPACTHQHASMMYVNQGFIKLIIILHAQDELVICKCHVSMQCIELCVQVHCSVRETIAVCETISKFHLADHMYCN